ncbi:hypothetical protein KTH02_14895, partial [Acinetobacter radioresistens]|uniref:hypothetical protein n=1 Tax=Acinetobacter radioresistens TaxID=40216 RepID=UPI0021CDAAAA
NRKSAYSKSGHFYFGETGHFYFGVTTAFRIMYIMLNRISETVAYTILFVATAQQREYLHLIHIDKYPNA